MSAQKSNPSDAEIGKVFSNSAKIIRENLKGFALLAIIFGAIFSFLYGAWRLPVIDLGFNRMSEANFIDYAYIFAVTVMSAALMTLMSHKVKLSSSSKKIGGAGGIFAAFVAASCPACQGVTLAALGTTLVFIPLGALSAFVWIMQLVALFILWISVYLVSSSIYTQTCITCVKPDGTKSEKPPKQEKRTVSGSGHSLIDNNKFFGALVVITLLVIANQFLIGSSGFVVASSGPVVSLSQGFNYGPKLTLKPMPIAVGETPKVAGYKTAVKSLPTISEIQIQSSTGDVTQDIVNNIIPHGTPWYGEEAGVSFDDPLTAQKLWGKGKAIQLDSGQEERWNRVVNSFTCDYCCGSPQQPTVITRCGCAHAAAAQGMARWFIKNYGDKYSDEEIYGEMARWYALWYPGPTVQRIVQELSVA